MGIFISSYSSKYLAEKRDRIFNGNIKHCQKTNYHLKLTKEV